MEAKPTCLQQLADFERERIDETLRKLELALAADDIGRAHRILNVFDQENQEQRRPLEALGLRAEVVSILNRAGVDTVQALREVSTETLRGLRGLTDSNLRQLFEIRATLELR
jgi:hypothetical protein